MKSKIFKICLLGILMMSGFAVQVSAIEIRGFGNWPDNGNSSNVTVLVDETNHWIGRVSCATVNTNNDFKIYDNDNGWQCASDDYRKFDMSGNNWSQSRTFSGNNSSDNMWIDWPSGNRNDFTFLIDVVKDNSDNYTVTIIREPQIRGTLAWFDDVGHVTYNITTGHWNGYLLRSSFGQNASDTEIKVFSGLYMGNGQVLDLRTKNSDQAVFADDGNNPKFYFRPENSDDPSYARYDFDIKLESDGYKVTVTRNITTTDVYIGGSMTTNPSTTTVDANNQTWNQTHSELKLTSHGQGEYYIDFDDIQFYNSDRVGRLGANTGIGMDFRFIEQVTTNGVTTNHVLYGDELPLTSEYQLLTEGATQTNTDYIGVAAVPHAVRYRVWFKNENGNRYAKVDVIKPEFYIYGSMSDNPETTSGTTWNGSTHANRKLTDNGNGEYYIDFSATAFDLAKRPNYIGLDFRFKETITVENTTTTKDIHWMTPGAGLELTTDYQEVTCTENYADDGSYIGVKEETGAANYRVWLKKDDSNGTEKYYVKKEVNVPPTISPNGGVFSSTDAQTVTLTGNNAETIYYTTDGTDPTMSSPHVNSGETVSVTPSAAGTVLKAAAAYGTSSLGHVTSATFTYMNISANGGLFINFAPITVAGGVPPFTYEVHTSSEPSSSLRTSGTSADGTIKISTHGYLTIRDSNGAEWSGSNAFDFTYSTSENYVNYYNNVVTSQITGDGIHVFVRTADNSAPYIKSTNGGVLSWTQMTETKTDSNSKVWYVYTFDSSYDNITVNFSDGTDTYATGDITLTKAGGNKYFLYGKSEYWSDSDISTKEGDVAYAIDVTNDTEFSQKTYVISKWKNDFYAHVWIDASTNENVHITSSNEVTDRLYPNSAYNSLKLFSVNSSLSSPVGVIYMTNESYENQTNNLSFNTIYIYKNAGDRANMAMAGPQTVSGSGITPYTYAKPNGEEYYLAVPSDKTYMLDPTWGGQIANPTTIENEEWSITHWSGYPVASETSEGGYRKHVEPAMNLTQTVHELDPTKEYTVQALVRATGESGTKVRLALGGATTVTVEKLARHAGAGGDIGSGVEGSFVTKTGRVEYLTPTEFSRMNKQVNVGWFKVQAKAYPNASGNLQITLKGVASDGETAVWFDLADVVLLEDADRADGTT